jgi:hypothetical protein
MPPPKGKDGPKPRGKWWKEKTATPTGSLVASK